MIRNNLCMKGYIETILNNVANNSHCLLAIANSLTNEANIRSVKRNREFDNDWEALP